MVIDKFEDINAWQEARILTQRVYDMTRTKPFSSDYSLVDQTRRAAVSSMANIAEDFDSATNKGFTSFLYYSQRSTTEVQSHLYVALDQKYLSNEQFDEIYRQCDKVKGLVGGFIKYLKLSNYEQRTKKD